VSDTFSGKAIRERHIALEGTPFVRWAYTLRYIVEQPLDGTSF